eukprot:10286757-Ditylum_brightwellii.AAC.1
MRRSKKRPMLSVMARTVLCNVPIRQCQHFLEVLVVGRFLDAVWLLVSRPVIIIIWAEEKVERGIHETKEDKVVML